MICSTIFDLHSETFPYVSTFSWLLIPLFIGIFFWLVRKDVARQSVGFAITICAILFFAFSFVFVRQVQDWQRLKSVENVLFVEGELKKHKLVQSKNGSEEAFEVSGVEFAYPSDSLTNAYFPIKNRESDMPVYLKIQYVTSSIDTLNSYVHPIVKLEKCQ